MGLAGVYKTVWVYTVLVMQDVKWGEFQNWPNYHGCDIFPFFLK